MTEAERLRLKDGYCIVEGCENASAVGSMYCEEGNLEVGEVRHYGGLVLKL